MMTQQRRLARPVAGFVWLLGLGVPLALGILVAALPPAESDGWAIPVYTFVVTSWSLVGSIIATRRPGHLVGWVVWGTGVWFGVALLGQMWGFLNAQVYGGSLPLPYAAWLGGLLFNPALGFALVSLPLCFPDGHLPSRRWRIVAVLLAVALLSPVVAGIALPETVISDPGVPIPSGIPALADLAATMAQVGSLLGIVCLPICLAAPFIRYRRGTPIERQQLKWFGATAGLAVLGILGAAVLPDPLGVAAFIVTTIALGLVPVSIGIAILRYRLYEIDRIVGRTLAYAIVTALLAVAFIGTNLALQAVLADVAGSSTLTTAAATLVVAGLFQPLRRRVQAPIDRRFNRTRVNGERVVASFAGELRDQVDLDRLHAAIVRTVDDAVAPEAASVWLRRAR